MCGGVGGEGEGGRVCTKNKETLLIEPFVEYTYIHIYTYTYMHIYLEYTYIHIYTYAYIFLNDNRT